MQLQEILSETTFNPNITLMKCLLGVLKTIPAGKAYFSGDNYPKHLAWVQEILILCRPVEKQSHIVSEAILDDVDRVMSHFRQIADPPALPWD